MKTKDPEQIFINDAKLVCNQCAGDQFYSSKYNPNKDGLNILGLDWMSHSVDVFICSTCGFFHWFATLLPSEMHGSPDSPAVSVECVVPELDPDKHSEPSECMSCGKVIPEGIDRCPSCGWTYK
jgi:hypothetical protein